MSGGETVPSENIILIGFMGSGKSSIARDLSTALGYPVVDTDSLVVEQAGKPIPAIFEENGEEEFRDRETAVLTELEQSGPTHRIVATGGGIVERPANRNILKKMGFVVWLVVSPEEILRRTAKNRERPLLNTDDPEETIRRLLERRVDFYRDTAHQEIETDDLTFPEITTGIVESARYFFSG